MAHHDFWSTRSSVDAQARASMSAPTAGVQTTRLPEPSPLPFSSATAGAAAGTRAASRAAPAALIPWKKPVPFRRGPSTNVPVQSLGCRSVRLQPGVPHRPVSSAQLRFIVLFEARNERVPGTL